jgi:integrase
MPSARRFINWLGIWGASQTDLALLTADNVNWKDRAVLFSRKKTGTRVLQFFDEETAAVLQTLPSEGPLFPYLRTVRAGDRATEFKQRCTGLKIKGVSLHSYRYAWAQRARLAGRRLIQLTRSLCSTTSNFTALRLETWTRANARFKFVAALRTWSRFFNTRSNVAFSPWIYSLNAASRSYGN